MRNERPLRIHWCATPYPARFIELSDHAERYGIESVNITVFDVPDALKLAAVDGARVRQIKFRIAWFAGAGLSSELGPQLKDAWDALGGRLIVHVHLRGDISAPDRNPLVAGEFITNCRRYFLAQNAPQFDVEGETAEAAFLAIKQADCLWRLPNRPSQVYADALPVLHFGKEVGLVSLVFARETREEAVAFAASLLPTNGPERLADPVCWITPSLWMDTLPGFGKQAALVGSYDEVAHALYEFKRSGISQFLVRELPDQQEITDFGASVLPRLRAIERGRMAD